MKMNNKFRILLVIVASAFLVGGLWSPPSVYAAGPTKSGDKVVKSGAKRTFKASSMGKYKARQANLGKIQSKATSSAAPGTVCYAPYWNGSGYSWNAAATYGGASAQVASQNVGQPAAAYQPQQASTAPNTVSVCYNVNPTTGCYSWVPCSSPPSSAWNAPAGAYRGNPTQVSSQAPLAQSAAPISTPAVTCPPAVTYPANPTTVCYNGCSPSHWTWNGTGWSAWF